MSQYTPGSAGAQIGENVIADKLDEMIEVLQPTNACTDIDISIPSSGWSSSSPYQYTYLNSKITDGCSIKTNFLEGNTDAVLYLESEKVTGGVRFTAPTKPTTSISVRIHVLNADATSTSSIDATEVSTNVISGSSNVAQALTSINNHTTPPSVNQSNFGLFFVFGSVRDGSYYFSNSFYVPIGYKIDESNATIPANASLTRTGCYYRLYTTDSSLAGKGTNMICKLIPDT